MKKTIVIFMATVLFTITNSHTQTLQSSNEDSKEIIEFLLKYKDNNKTPTKKEFNKLLANLGIHEIVSNNGMTKEVAFKLIDFYFKYSEENQSTNSAGFDKENIFLNSLSYINFRNQIKVVNPYATDLEIQKVFIEMHEKLKNL
ncbi:MAG: hypothetical protein GQ540_04705 [Lutibacter sp.]|uniref:hypothetical protein n=1 Tax=Lutibacter sp. TaxID=1925666 RepID=UPI0019FF2528|nr:hypothetical protein [Lutibacter sp.]NOR27812.1 hypothetical protein [Lutibacter sp.]